jgi:RNA polymerase sigma factor (sigma-70 family)
MASTTSTSSDAELISAVRSGDNDAYGELFSRHHEAAMRMARQLVLGPDADDLVAEAFVRVMAIVQAGKGPDEFFRAYLLSSIRRLHIDRIRATQRVRPTGDEAELDRVVRFVDPVEMTFEQKAAADAFASLPERWQLVLWHLDVEGQKPAQIAPLLGLSPNSVSALAYRAREGLRLAYLQGHLAPPRDDNCSWTTSHLGQYVRKALSKRDTATVDDHLETCSRCSALYLELAEVNSNLPGLLAPVVIGTAATGYLSSGAAAAVTGTFGQVIDWFTKPFRSTSKAGPVVGTVVAAVAVVAVGAVAIAQVVKADDPRTPVPVAAPTQPGETAPAAPGDELNDPTHPTPTASTLAPTPAPVATRDGGLTLRPTTRPSDPTTPPTTPTTPPGPTSTDYGVVVQAFVEDAPHHQRSTQIDVTALGDVPRGNTVTLTLGFSAELGGNVYFRGGLSSWACGSLTANQQLTTVTCSLTQTGPVVPPLEISLFGCNPTITVSVAATNNQDGVSTNDSASRRADDYAGTVSPGETCQDPNS